MESANDKDSISLITKENSENLKEPEKESKPIENPPENDISSQISSVPNDLVSKPKETETALHAIDTLRKNTAEILSRPNNPELEKDFRTACSAIQTNSSLNDPPLMQAYQDYLNAYQQKTSLYSIIDQDDGAALKIFNTETETQEVKTLQTSAKLDRGTCITQLPNGKIFGFGNFLISGITVLIDGNGGVEELPSGTPCVASSCIYLNNSIYCFGGKGWSDCLTLSSKFDLDQNQWIQLTPMSQPIYGCSSVIFNESILISGYENRNIWQYSIDIDSFSVIPYEFGYKGKILINAERLYLIEYPGSIYESEIGSYLNWRQIGKFKTKYDPYQIYYSYNKGGIWISTVLNSVEEYFYLNLDQKIIIEAAYYHDCFSLRRVGEKIEAKKRNDPNFKLDPYYLDKCNLKDTDLCTLGENLEGIQLLDEEIKCNPNDFFLYSTKAKFFNNLKWHLEAIKCYDKAIKLESNNVKFYFNKGKAFYGLGRYLEALECYDEAIKLNPGKADFYYKKGQALNELGRYLETVESYNEAIKSNPYKIEYYNDKARTLCVLERYQEAIQCYDEMINREPKNPLHFCNRGRAFKNLRQEEAALQDWP